MLQELLDATPIATDEAQGDHLGLVGGQSPDTELLAGRMEYAIHFHLQGIAHGKIAIRKVRILLQHTGENMVQGFSSHDLAFPIYAAQPSRAEPMEAG